MKEYEVDWSEKGINKVDHEDYIIQFEKDFTRRSRPMNSLFRFTNTGSPVDSVSIVAQAARVKLNHISDKPIRFNIDNTPK